MTRQEAIKESGGASIVYFEIIKFIKEFGYSPTLDEIRERTHIGSKRTVIKYVRKLRQLNLIEAELKKSRTIVVRGYEYMDKGENLTYGYQSNES